MKRCTAVLALLVALASGASTARGQERPATEQVALSLRLVADVDLPGPATRFDYQSYDRASHRLFIAHLGASRVLVFDTRSNSVVGEVPNVSQVHGVLAVAAIGKLYASATGTSEVVAIDLQTLKEFARAPGGVYPDGIAYAPDAQKLYVSDETGRTETVIDTRTSKRVATIPLGGEVGNTQYDSNSKHIFINVQTRNELVEIDPQTDSIVGRYALTGSRGNHGLLIDPSERVAYVACEGNATLLTVDLDTKQVIARDTTGDGPDVLAFDDALRLLYVASESGVVTVFEQQGKRLQKRGESVVARRAHTVALDPETHRVYFPIENLGGHATMRIMEPTRR